MKALTVRSIPPEVAEALEHEKRRRGTSLNQTVIDLLKQSLGVQGTRSNGLMAFGGSWSEDEFHEFERAIAPFENVDPELWK